MNIEEIREYCLSLPMTSEDMAFGEEYLLLRVCGKIFACIALERSESLVLKCDPAYAVELFDKLWAGADPRIPGLKADDRLAYFVSSDIYRLYI